MLYYVIRKAGRNQYVIPFPADTKNLFTYPQNEISLINSLYRFNMRALHHAVPPRQKKCLRLRRNITVFILVPCRRHEIRKASTCSMWLSSGAASWTNSERNPDNHRSEHNPLGIHTSQTKTLASERYTSGLTINDGSCQVNKWNESIPAAGEIMTTHDIDNYVLWVIPWGVRSNHGNHSCGIYRARLNDDNHHR